MEFYTSSEPLNKVWDIESYREDFLGLERVLDGRIGEVEVRYVLKAVQIEICEQRDEYR